MTVKKSESQKAKAREERSERMRKQWQDPVYRERISSMLRGQALHAVCVRDGVNFPKPGTPEWRYYRKLYRTLGLEAARKEFGIALRKRARSSSEGIGQ